ncbi:MAG: radical SAM protein [Chloroflexota bacterium]
MSRRTVFLPYRPRAILNKARRADHWFWARYSAYPYIGCQHGCAFCYCRERKYSPFEDPADFAYIIKVKENAPELLERALRRVPVDLVFTGDYQPAERKFGLSHQMLEVCLRLGFPVFVLERSPLVLRDLDLLQDIHAQAPSVVAFSIIATPDSPNHEWVRRLEGLAPPAERRFAAMRRLADAGLMTGTCAMPLLPALCDDETTLESIVRWTRDHGGQFVLAGGLTLADQQRDYFLQVVRSQHLELASHYEALYPPGSYGPPAKDWRRVARRVRELCEQFGLRDRIPRPIIPGDKRARNRRLVEWLADQAYSLELEAAPSHRIWAYRRAAWAIEDLEQDIGLVYRTLGRRGLETIPGVGPAMAPAVEARLTAEG